MQFQLQAPFGPAGDQPQAIRELLKGIQSGRKEQVLMGVTGSGKTFTMANVIQELQRPTLVLSHNKTLAAQLYSEFKEFFPHNAVNYFVSYYDYYQPEAYIPQRDIYIEKDASINEEIDRLRLATTSSLVSRRDVIIVASVSCIYGLGSPDDYKAMMVGVSVGDVLDRDDMLGKLVDIQYERNDIDLRAANSACAAIASSSGRATKSSPIASNSGATKSNAFRSSTRPRGETIDKLESVYIYPAKHFVLPEERIHAAVDNIRAELDERLELFKSQGKLLEAQRLNARTRFDIEMMMEMGYCPGIENYSRPLSGRTPASRRTRCSISFPKIICCSSTNRTPRCRKSAACSTAIAAARSRSSSTASACRARSITARSNFPSGKNASIRWFTSRPRPARSNWNKPAAKSSSK